MKRRIFFGQSMVEYALLLTMIVIPITIIFATLGDAIGNVWVAVVESVEGRPMFAIPTANIPRTRTITEILTREPTKTLEPETTWFPSLTPAPSITPSITLEPTPVPSATMTTRVVEDVSISRTRRSLTVYITVNRQAQITVFDYQSFSKKSVECQNTCSIKFSGITGAGYIGITSNFGDEIFLFYPAYY